MIPFSEINGSFEIVSDGRTVWVNAEDGCCVGRFSVNGIDVHHDGASQLALGKQCLDCKPGPCDLSDWRHFQRAMREHYGIWINTKHRPEYLWEDAA
jgi:hypothetical protein